MIEYESTPKALRKENQAQFCERLGIPESTYKYNRAKKENKRRIVEGQQKAYYPEYIALVNRIEEDLKNGKDKREIVEYIDIELVVKVFFLKLSEPFVSFKKSKENIRIRASKKYSEWRKSVFERDNFKCQKCGKIGGRLNSHHIKPFAYFKDDRFDINNGVTLCEDCHRKTENYGRKCTKFKTC